MAEYDATASTMTFNEKGVYTFNVAVDLGTEVQGNIVYIELHKDNVQFKRIAHHIANAGIGALYGTLTIGASPGEVFKVMIYSSNAITTRTSFQRTTYMCCHRVG